MDSSSTRTVDRTLAVSEFASDGHGDWPLLAPKNSRYPCKVSGAASDGGLVAASASVWNEVSTIQSRGATNSRPMIQAMTASRALPRGLRSLRGLPVAVRVAGTGPTSVTALIGGSPP